jgi:ABC-type molybdate transport system substrate-binding protein
MWLKAVIRYRTYRGDGNCSLCLGFFTLSDPNPLPPEPTPLKTYCAGSLLYPLERVATAFEAAHPTVDVEVEAS